MNKIREDISKWPIKKRVEKLKEIFKAKMGYELNLENPRYFSEMIQWIKLFYHDPLMKRLIDKVSFKEYIKELFGNDDYTAKVYMIWESSEEVDLEKIPKKCAIKSNCSGDGNNIILVANKSKLDLGQIAREIKDTWFDPLALHTNSFANYYYDIKPKVIVEEYLQEAISGNGADTYSVFCFHGEPKLFCVQSEHFYNGRTLKEFPVSFYGLDWTFMNIKYEGHTSSSSILKPQYAEDMLDISRKISAPFPFIRIDFFANHNGFKLAEVSFAPGAGLRRYEPESFNLQMGKWLDIVHTAKKEFVKKY